MFSLRSKNSNQAHAVDAVIPEQVRYERGGPRAQPRPTWCSVIFFPHLEAGALPAPGPAEHQGEERQEPARGGGPHGAASHHTTDNNNQVVSPSQPYKKTLPTAHPFGSTPEAKWATLPEGTRELISQINDTIQSGGPSSKTAYVSKYLGFLARAICSGVGIDAAVTMSDGMHSLADGSSASVLRAVMSGAVMDELLNELPDCFTDPLAGSVAASAIDETTSRRGMARGTDGAATRGSGAVRALAFERTTVALKILQ